MLQLTVSDEFARFFAALPDREAEPVAREAFEEVMRSVGLDPERLPGALEGLREVTVQTPSLPIRVIYALAPRSRRAHVLIADRLDRPYLGDSVRRAERLHAAWLAGLSESAVPEPVA